MLDRLIDQPGVLGQLVRAYPGQWPAEPSGAWLTDLFRELVQADFLADSVNGEADTDLGGLADELIQEIRSGLSRVSIAGLRLRSLRPNYFRGFLAVPTPIDLGSQLVVIYGRNSAGKTSLAEALEWLFTGTLARRAMGQLGNARELERCIGNQFRPEGETTWVEAVFNSGETTITLRRVLVEDFGATQTSQCRSALYHDGRELSPADGTAMLASLFGGVAPLLMQHTLRSFVHSSPAERRGYFEQLLRLDELTYLIEKAVIGDARLPEFVSESGSLGFRKWQNTRALAVSAAARAALRRTERCAVADLPDAVRETLRAIAASEYPDLVQPGDDLDAVVAAISREQQNVRQRSFTPLASVRPRRWPDDSVRSDLDLADLLGLLQDYSSAQGALHVAQAASALIGESQLAIAQAFVLLESAGLIDGTAADAQGCPLCTATPPSLSVERVTVVRTWEPVRHAVAIAEERTRTAGAALHAKLQLIWKLRADLFPKVPDSQVWSGAASGASQAVQVAAQRTYERLDQIRHTLADFDRTLVAVGTALKEAPAAVQTKYQLDQSERVIQEGIRSLEVLATAYLPVFNELEASVGIHAVDDPQYTRREKWIAAATDIDGIGNDLRWERSKVRAQKALRSARETLIVIRQVLLESRRAAFSDGMNSVWGVLRRDRYARFHSLSIPAPRGRGFPIEIEVKAKLDGPSGTHEVDALRVFSESQVHVLGLAAFVTRSKLVGHQMLVLDDPVQSMDEDHFKTFAGPFLQALLADGFQVVVLTHNQSFDRDISFQHYDFDGYATLEVKHTRRLGCRVQEGNRRVAERLDLAEKKVEEGDLVTAWIAVRKAIERLYTVVFAKYGPEDFDPMSWTRHTAGNMWDQGAGEIITARVPEASRRLRSILSMTAGSAHDGEQSGETDLLESTAYLRSLLGLLQVGG